MTNKEIYLAGGCFWGTEKYFELIPGVIKTDVGYANGNGDTNYQILKETDHAETVHVIYDEEVLSLRFLLECYFDVIDPTSINKQGEDAGRQYRTGIYYICDSDRSIIDGAINELSKKYDKPIVVEVEKLRNYILAEDYHQKYLDKNPSGYCHIGNDKFEKAKESKDKSK